MNAENKKRPLVGVRALELAEIWAGPYCGALLGDMGAEIVKVFPGTEVGGPDFVKSVLGPCPWTRIMPTGGVDATRASLEAWFKAGVTCVGVGSKLITKEIISNGDFDTLTENVRQVVGWIKEIRAEMD